MKIKSKDSWIRKDDKRENRRQFLLSLFLLLGVLLLGAVCAAAYFHMKGVFVS